MLIFFVFKDSCVIGQGQNVGDRNKQNKTLIQKASRQDELGNEQS